MWIGQRSAGAKEIYEPWVEHGEVTQNGGVTGVYLEGERRSLQVASAGGYRWKPSVGDDVLVLKENLGDGTQHILGVCDVALGDLSPGDVEISSGASAKVRLSGDKVTVTGALYYQGQSLEEYIRDLVRQEIGGV